MKALLQILIFGLLSTLVSADGWLGTDKESTAPVVPPGRPRIKPTSRPTKWVRPQKRKPPPAPVREDLGPEDPRRLAAQRVLDRALEEVPGIRVRSLSLLPPRNIQVELEADNEEHRFSLGASVMRLYAALLNQRDQIHSLNLGPPRTEVEGDRKIPIHQVSFGLNEDSDSREFQVSRPPVRSPFRSP